MLVLIVPLLVLILLALIAPNAARVIVASVLFVVGVGVVYLMLPEVIKYTSRALDKQDHVTWEQTVQPWQVIRPWQPAAPDRRSQP